MSNPHAASNLGRWNFFFSIWQYKSTATIRFHYGNTVGPNEFKNLECLSKWRGKYSKHSMHRNPLIFPNRERTENDHETKLTHVTNSSFWMRFVYRKQTNDLKFEFQTFWKIQRLIRLPCVQSVSWTPGRSSINFKVDTTPAKPYIYQKDQFCPMAWNCNLINGFSKMRPYLEPLGEGRARVRSTLLGK